MNLQKLKGLLKNIVGAYIYYAAMCFLTYLTYEFMLKDLCKIDISFVNFLGMYHIVLILGILIKLTIADDK